jgi:hypothetical protein
METGKIWFKLGTCLDGSGLGSVRVRIGPVRELLGVGFFLLVRVRGLTVGLGIGLGLALNEN